MTLLEKIRCFAVVKPNWYIKCFDYLDWVGMGSSFSIAHKGYKTFSNCEELCEHFQIPIHDFVSFVPEEISE